MAQVEFKLEDEKTFSLNPAQTQSFISITNVASWKLIDEKGQVLYTGLIISGPKPLPGGNFQMMADFSVDIPTDPRKGIPMAALPKIQEAVMTEFQKRAVIQTYAPPTTKQ